MSSAPAVFMGVSGCGKSSVAAAVAAELGWALVEGDDFHTAASRDKMSRGIALDDDDRAQWLDTLARLLHGRSELLLTCSALKRRYRDVLRAGSPGLRFVFLRLAFEEAERRVAARAGSHFFGPSLVRSQFDALEPPDGEPHVLCVDATRPLPELARGVAAWLRAPDDGATR